MAKAIIYRPDKTAMQSGKAGMDFWLLEFAPEQPYFIDDLMGWSGMTDMKQELQKRLRFPTKEAAIEYAERQRIAYEVFEPKPRDQVTKAYADNFKFGRKDG